MGNPYVSQVKDKFNKVKSNFHLSLIKKIFFFKKGRALLLNNFKKKLYKFLIENEDFPKNVQIKKYYFLVSLLESTKRNYDKGWISKEVAEHVINTLVKFGFVDKEATSNIRESFKEKYDQYPPSFVVLSPTQKCNLNCEGCYASSKINAPILDYETVDKIVDEVYNEWGNRFMTISGGEPFMYNDDGKTLFDIWKKYSNMFFLIYTNGTLINKENAKKLAEVKNVTPAISVEGFEKETDERRGKGIFKKINTLLDDKFYDYVFQELGASYMWMFQLMPIGQAKDMKEMMITPEQRVNLYRKWEQLFEEKNYAIVDFWNSGVLSNGCIAYGRYGGYLYIDWNGNITPCVFVPYYEDNIKDLYKKNKKLADALFSELFKAGRKWQKEYGLNNTKKPHNWLMPCSIRDHWSNFKNNILNENIKPQDECARQVLNSKEYTKVLEKFNKELEELTEPIWEKEFLEEKLKKDKKLN